MLTIKDTGRARVKMLPNGSFDKSYRHRNAKARFHQEVAVLRHLEQADCPNVPRLLWSCPFTLRIRTSNCGAPVEHLSDEKVAAIFDELEAYGIRHEDRNQRNITYDAKRGCFCVIDFEFATILGSDSLSDELGSVGKSLVALDAAESLLSELT